MLHWNDQTIYHGHYVRAHIDLCIHLNILYLMWQPYAVTAVGTVAELCALNEQLLQV